MLIEILDRHCLLMFGPRGRAFTAYGRGLTAFRSLAQEVRRLLKLVSRSSHMNLPPRMSPPRIMSRSGVELPAGGESGLVEMEMEMDFLSIVNDIQSAKLC